MRVFQIGAVGTAFAYVAFSYSQAASGFPQATAFMLAILVTTLTVGIATGAGLHAWPDDFGITGGRPIPVHGCHGCGRPMVEIHSAWMCGRCDRVG